jgi:xylulokinase
VLLGLDIGSSAVKGSLVDPETGVLSTAQVDVRFHSVRPGWAEADPGEWWLAICSLIPTLLSDAGRPAGEIAAVASAGMVPAVLPLNAEGNPLRRAILQNDARATREITEVARMLEGLDLLGLTGSELTQQSVAPTLRWLKSNEPDLFTETDMITGSYDWVARRLGAEPHVEQNWALESGLFTLDCEPIQEIAERTDLPSSLLPDVRLPGAVIGGVSSRAAEETGLRQGTPIVVGGADHVSSAYGAGLLKAGDWLLKLGGAGDILVVTDAPLVDARLYLDAHPAGGWLPNGCMASSGSVVRWLRRVTGGDTLEALDAEAAASPPGASGVVCLPYFLGEKSPLHDPELRGALVGLHLGHGRGDLLRAVLESVAYGFRHHVDVFRERGVDLGLARVTNGGSRSVLWKQILADVLGVELSPVVDHPGASFAAAITAGVGTGAVASWNGIEPLVKLGAPIAPRREYQARYDELYSLYRELESALRPISHRLSARDWA